MPAGRAEAESRAGAPGLGVRLFTDNAAQDSVGDSLDEAVDLGIDPDGTRWEAHEQSAAKAAMEG